MLYNAGAFENAATAYATIYPELFDQTAFLSEYAHCLSKTGQYSLSNKILEEAVKISCDPMLQNEIKQFSAAL